MTQAMHYPDTATLKKWFYYAAVGFVLWPILMYLILFALYDGQLAPGYTASFAQHLPVITSVVAQLVIQVALLAVSVMLALRVVTVWKKVALVLVAIVALYFSYVSISGLVSYIDLIS